MFSGAHGLGLACFFLRHTISLTAELTSISSHPKYLLYVARGNDSALGPSSHFTVPWVPLQLFTGCGCPEFASVVPDRGESQVLEACEPVPAARATSILKTQLQTWVTASSLAVSKGGRNSTQKHVSMWSICLSSELYLSPSLSLWGLEERIQRNDQRG